MYHRNARTSYGQIRKINSLVHGMKCACHFFTISPTSADFLCHATAFAADVLAQPARVFLKPCFDVEMRHSVPPLIFGGDE